MAPLLDQLRATLDQPHAIADMAASLCMSKRTFLRHFQAATELAPGAWLTNERLRRARELLEQTGAPVDIVAHRSGFGTATTSRHHFRQHLGITPVDYRRRFIVVKPSK